MGESLTMRRCVKDEGLRIVNFCHEGRARRRPDVSDVKAPGSTREVRSKLFGWSTEGGCGMQGVAVKCVDILQNTGGEGGILGRD